MANPIESGTNIVDITEYRRRRRDESCMSEFESKSLRQGRKIGKKGIAAIYEVLEIAKSYGDTQREDVFLGFAQTAAKDALERSRRYSSNDIDTLGNLEAIVWELTVLMYENSRNPRSSNNPGC